MRSGGVLLCCARVQGNRKQGNGSLPDHFMERLQNNEINLQRNTVVSQVWESASKHLSGRPPLLDH